MIDESLVARIYTRDRQGIDRVGTGYPLSENLLITALHVVAYPEQDTDAGIEIVWDECDHASDTVALDAIIYRGDQQAGQYDLALLRCQTPLTHTVSLLSIPPSAHTECYCFGYPLAGLHKQKPQHDRLTFSGSTDGNSQEAELEITTLDVVQEVEVEGEDGFAIENWQGLSGSPVIINQEIAGIVAIKYTTVAKKLFAVSLPYVLSNCEVFRQCYAQARQKNTSLMAAQASRKQDLATQLANVKGLDLPCCDDMVTAFKHKHSAYIDKLTQNIPAHLSDKKDELIRLVYLLLAQVDMPPCEEESAHLYELQVGTALVSEAVVANLYDASPAYKSSDVGVAGLQGENVLPPSVTEKGYQDSVVAEEQALAVAHAVYKNIHKKSLKNIGSKKSIVRYQGLNQHLANIREQKQLVRFELDREDEVHDQHPLMSPDVLAYLKKHLLPELLVVFYGEDYAFDDEPDLESKMGIFMQKIQSL